MMSHNEILESILYNQKKVFNLKWLNIEFSTKCNLQCKWCSIDHNKKREFISEDILIKLFNEISSDQRFKIDCIDLHNAGEILLDRQLEKKLNLISGYKTIAQVGILTNATLLTKDISKCIISSNAIDLIRFSVDGGSRKNFENIRKGAKWETVKKNISNFIRMNKGTIKTSIICIIPEDNELCRDWMEPEFQDLLALVDSVELRHPHNWDGRKELGIKTSEQAFTGKNFCKFLKKNLVVLPNGDVTACCADLNSEGVLGNIKEQSLAEIFLSNKRISIIKNFLMDNKENIHLCKNCSGYYE